MGFLEKILDSLMNIFNTNNDNFKNNNYEYEKYERETSKEFKETSKKLKEKKLCEYIKVAGVSYRMNNLLNFINADGKDLLIEKEINNKFDKYAIKVIGVYKNRYGKEIKTHIGYIPKEYAKKIYGYNNLIVKIKEIFKPTDKLSAGLRIDVFAKE